MHDFDPGITPYPGGLFWTDPLRNADILRVDGESGDARLSVADLAVVDYFDIPNALLRFEDPLSSAAMCSFDITWSGPVTDRSPVTAPAGSTGQLVTNSSTMSWSATNDQGFTFETDTSPTTSVFAQIGRVRNGVFGDGGPGSSSGRHGATSHPGWDRIGSHSD